MNLWHDNCLPRGSLRSTIQGPLNADDEVLRVKDVFGINGWDWSSLSFHIPNQVLLEINSIPITVRANQGEDRLIWAGANQGDFDLKYAYALAMGNEAKDEDFNGSWVWKLDTIPRVKTFIWQCLHNSIGVGECLVKRCISESNICPLCQKEPESILHRLRDCVTSKQTWERLGINPSNAFYEGNLIPWLETNCKDNSCRLGEQPPWKILFSFTIWLLWKQRNDVVFGNQWGHPNIHKEAMFRAFKFQHCGLNTKTLGGRKVVCIRWEKPQAGWAHLNTDGAPLGSPGRGGGGDLIRNDQGE